MAVTVEDVASFQKYVEEVTFFEKGKHLIRSKFYNARVIRTEFELHWLVKKMRKLEEFSFDTECTSLAARHPGKSEIVGISIAWSKNNAYYIPVGHIADEDYPQLPLSKVIKSLKPIFENPNIRLIGHNLKFDIHVLANIGINVRTTDVWDTLVAYWNIDENDAHDLKSIVHKFYGFNQATYDILVATVDKEVKRNFGLSGNQKATIDLTSVFYCALYAIDDAFWTWQLYSHLLDVLEDEECEDYFYQRQMPYSLLLYKKEREGVKIDIPRLLKMQKLAGEELEKLTYEIYEVAGLEFNIGSDQQLQELIFGYERQKPIYREYEELIFDENGEPIYYKSGKNKGKQKFVTKKDKDTVIGYENSFNPVLVQNSFNFQAEIYVGSGAPSVARDSLEKVLKKKYKSARKKEGQEMIRLILEWKKLSKLKTTYMDGLLQQIYPDGRVHPSFNQAGTTSGRLSCSDPNLQNIPRPLEEVYVPIREKFKSDAEYESAFEKYEKAKEYYDYWIRFEIRDLLIPDDEEHVILSFDYKNLEMMVMAHFSQDPNLIEMFKQGADTHGYTAVQMFNLSCEPNEAKKLFADFRQRAKVLNFLLIYGGSAFALSSDLDIPKGEAQELYDLYFDTFIGVKDYISFIKRYGRRHGFVRTVLSRKRHLTGINSDNFKVRGYFERLALNAPIQGSAADIVISAQLLIENDEELRKLGFVQKIQVHDEVVGQCHKNVVDKVAKRVVQLMENALPKPLDNVDLKVDAGWSDISYARAKG